MKIVSALQPHLSNTRIYNIVVVHQGRLFLAGVAFVVVAVVEQLGWFASLKGDDLTAVVNRQRYAAKFRGKTVVKTNILFFILYFAIVHHFFFLHFSSNLGLLYWSVLPLVCFLFFSSASVLSFVLSRVRLLSG